MALRHVAGVATIFFGFALQGAWPVPDVNEPHYVAKTIAYWNKDWIKNDPFLSSADAHPVFYIVFGWPSLFLEAEQFTWLARALGWLLVAAGWYTFASQLLPEWWQVALSGLVFGLLQERFNMAGEWVIGGIEAKVPAYGFLFLGLAALVQARWNLAWLLFGIAGAFHILVGGWALVASTLTWLLSRDKRYSVFSALPGLGLAVVLSGPSLIAALKLTWGVDPAIVAEANQIYLFRLGHHLSLLRTASGAIDRFLLLTFLWLLLECLIPGTSCQLIFRRFAVASILLGLIGACLSGLEFLSPVWAASLLRYYWFRLADVMIPAAVAVAGCRLHLLSNWSHPGSKVFVHTALVTAVALHLVYCGFSRLGATIPRADENQVEDYAAWRDLCQWVAQSGQVPPGSRFLTPRTSYTFRWYARRPDVVNWKDIPQDAPSIVAWWRTLCQVHAYRDATGQLRWLPSLAYAGADRLRDVATKLSAPYIICPVWPTVDLPVLYRNSTYVIYYVPEADKPSR